MIGHGSPRTSLKRPARNAAVLQGWRFALLLLLLLPAPTLPAAEMRVRIAWGGGDERQFHGTVALTHGGVLSQPIPLGIEADEPGSIWLERGQLVIRQRSPRAYDGVDLLLNAPLEANLLVQLAAVDATESPAMLEIPLADLLDDQLGEFQERQIDARGNRLLVRRAPGDVLRVSFSRDQMVFSPGEVFQFTVQLSLPFLPTNGKVQIKTRLVSTADGQELQWREHDASTGQSVGIPMEFELPPEEGVYDLIITATPKANLQRAIRQPLNWNKPLVERKIQLLVLQQNPPIDPGEPAAELKQIGKEIDPIPGWQDRLVMLPQPLKLPGLPTGPLGSGNMTVRRHPLLGEVALLAPNNQATDVSWEAYTLPISQLGRPHILEIDYPSDVLQTLGISILEPNAVGALMPVGLASGFDTDRKIIDDEPAPQWLRHRLVFWPHSETPLLFLSNLRDDSPAQYGRIRVYAGWQQLPRAIPSEPSDAAPPSESPRLVIGYFDRPLFPENFSAAEALDTLNNRSLDDWTTFYQGGNRLVEYLQHVGYNGLMLSVMADGSTIYPSRFVEPTPRYDTGTFFATAQDPVRKDVLEMLFRLFDRERMHLISAVEFAAPLPELESIRRAGGPDSQAIEWIGPDGASWCETHRTHRGLCPYYNLLDPRVQQAMHRVVRELIDRYGHHPSFAGLAIQLSPDGYAQLPGPEWGMDDATIARFEQATGVKVPGQGPTRFAERARFLLAEGNRPLWLQWRADELGRFYHKLHAEVTAATNKGRLYLAGAAALSGTPLEESLRPALPRTLTLYEALLHIGIDTKHYGSPEGPVLLRPEQITSGGRLGDQAIDLEISAMPDADECFERLAVPASLFYHRPRQVRVESFDQQSPFQPAYTWLVSQPVPSNEKNRQRFVHSLASMDSLAMVDGGWMLPLGQEDAIRPLIVAYRHLPATAFRSANPGQAGTTEPVTFRYATYQGQTYVYVVNDSPVHVTAWVRLDAPTDCRIEELTGRRNVDPLAHDDRGTYWKVQLLPYDLVAVRLSVPGVVLSDPRVTLPSTLEPVLAQRIRELGVRAASLRSPLPLEVLDNPGFESPPTNQEPIPGWAATQQPGVEVQLDTQHSRQGSQSVRMSTNGPWACLVSQPLEPPQTGRLRMSVWLRVADPAAQPSLQLAFEGKLDGQRYYRHAVVGRVPDGAPAAAPIGTEWTQYVFPVDDLPLEGLSQLHVRFDMRGPGEVWIDELELSELEFTVNERKELTKLIMLANVTLEDGKIGECLRLLDSYWPRFLEAYVPLPPGGVLPLAPPTPVEVAAPLEQAPPKTGLLDRVRGLLPMF